MRQRSIFLFSILCWGHVLGFFSNTQTPQEVLEIFNSIDNTKQKFKEDILKLEDLKKIRDDEIKEKDQTLKQTTHELEKLKKEKKEYEDGNNLLIEENTSLVSKHKKLEDEIYAQITTLNTNKEEIEKQNKKLEKLKDENQIMEESKNELENSKNQLITDIKAKENQINTLSTEINTHNSVKENVLNDIEVAKNDHEILKLKLSDLKKDIAVLKNEKGNLHKEICKEFYTLWNPEFLSNNKTSIFISLLITVVLSSLIPFFLGIMTSSSTSESLSVDSNSLKSKSFPESSFSSLEQMSDDEDTSEMVASSSSALLNRDIKYNYNRDIMEGNEDPGRCFMHLKKKYGIKENLKLHWESLKNEESIFFNFWKVENGQLTFTKMMLKKIVRLDKPLLTFELFQTQTTDANLKLDCEETELSEADKRIEAKLALRICDGLPNFSV